MVGGSQQQHQQQQFQLQVDLSSSSSSSSSDDDDDGSNSNNKMKLAAATKLRNKSHQHTASTIALCLVIFTFSYLLISVFPYGGFMAMELIPYVTEENAGSYAGLISSSFMVGRAITAYGWGKLADVYGRVVVLQVSLVLSFVFSLLFGLSDNFFMALFWRFCLGAGNCMVSTVKTCVSELAGGQKYLEAHTMNIVMSMMGGAALVAPALSGAIAEPVKQYPNIEWLQESQFGQFLDLYPFFLPNLIGAFICVLGILFVHFFVYETLPSHKCRHVKHIPGDVVSSVRNIYYQSTLPAIPETAVAASVTETTPLSNNFQTVIYTDGGGKSNNNDESENDAEVDLPIELVLFLQDDIEDAIRESQLLSDDVASAINTDAARRSLVRRAVKRTSIASSENKRRMSEASSVSGASTTASLPPATISSLWAQKSVRTHLCVYWFAAFIMVFGQEAFPLFCMSVAAGLGVAENPIGQVMSVSGLIFFVLQLSMYAPLLAQTGLYGSVRLGAICTAPFAVIVPISILLNRGASQGGLQWGAFCFLAVCRAGSSVAQMTFFSGLTVALNRLVPASHRATLVGLCTLGGSIAKGIGPAFAGFLVAFFFSSGLFPPHVGAFLLYGTVGMLNALAAIASFRYLRDPDQNSDGQAEQD